MDDRFAVLFAVDVSITTAAAYTTTVSSRLGRREIHEYRETRLA